MHACPFAHSSPNWIEAVGSTDPKAKKAWAADLIRAIDASERIAKAAYRETEMNRMMTRFEEARKRLREMME